MKNLPRETTIAGQRHMLAYINPFEVDLLRNYGASPVAGPGDIPAFPPTAAQKKEIEKQQAERAAQRDDRAPPGTYSGTGVSLKTVDTPAGPKTVSSASTTPKTVEVKTTAELRAEKDDQRNDDVVSVEPLRSTSAGTGSASVAPAVPSAATNLIGAASPQQIADLRAGIGQRNFLEQAFAMTLPGQIMMGLSDREKQQIADKLEGKYENKGILGLGIGKGLFERGAVSYQAVFDPQGNIVGALGFNADGAPVDYSGRRMEGFESGNPAIDALVRPSEAGLAGSGGGGDDGSISAGADPCPEGYEMDPVARVCVLKRTDVTQPVGPAPVGPAPVAPPPPPPLPPVAVAPPPPPQYTQVGPRPGVPPLMPYGAPPAAQQTIYTPPPAMQGQGIMQNLR